jgi:hypothetical protein
MTNTQHTQMTFSREIMHNAPAPVAPESELRLICEVNHKLMCEYCGMCRRESFYKELQSWN